MKLVALVALLLALSYLPRFVAALPPPKRKELGRTVLAVATAAAVVFVFRHVGVILVTLGVLGYYLGSGGAAQGVRQWLFGTGKPGRSHGRAGASASVGKDDMTRAEALEILGLKEGATRDEILAQYRVLMKKVHPDVPGGSDYLATRVNMAKAALLGDR